jgi:hypothetical protein
VKSYIVLKYEDLDSQASMLDIPYHELESQMREAHKLDGQCVYFKRYESWYWLIIHNALPVDWVMALVLA